MKQVWSSPKTSFEQFVPQVYCKNCSTDDNTQYTYNFVCDAGVDGGNYKLYKETNNTAGLQTNNKYGNDTNLTSGGYVFNPCEVTHTVTVMGKLSESNLNNIFPKGYLVKDGKVISEVRIWDGEHCTTALDVDDFQLAKS